MKSEGFAAHVETVLLGNSPAIRELRSVIRRLAPLNMPVFIHGPTGSGKELVAQLLHKGSGMEGAFVALNVCAVAESMFEAQFFGHLKGAFTGALSDVSGYLTQAHRGTLFLDEIGHLAAPQQGKLLRAVETRQFRPIGSRQDACSEFRLISATNADVDRMVADGVFREDLLYRLGLRVRLTPLESRREDIPLLADHFLRNSMPDGNTRSLSNCALDVLMSHHWPGNVRELGHVISTVAALTSGPLVTADDFRFHRFGKNDRPSGPSVSARTRLQVALAAAGYDTDLVARGQGVARSTIYRRMRRLGIQLPSTILKGPADEGKLSHC